MMSESAIGPYSVSGVKTFNGMEGQGFNAVLRCNGKKIADVIDDASGGEVVFWWSDKSAKAALDAHCATLPPAFFTGENNDIPYPTDAEIFASDLVNHHLDMAKIKRLCKTKTVFAIKGKEGVELLSTTAVGPRAWESLLAEYGERLVEIYNKRFA